MSTHKNDTERRSKTMFWGLVWFGVGLFFLALNMGWISWLSWNSWPLILIIIGGALVIRSLLKSRIQTEKPGE